MRRCTLHDPNEQYQQDDSCRPPANEMNHILRTETLHDHIFARNNDDGSGWHGLMEWHLGSYRSVYSIDSDLYPDVGSSGNVQDSFLAVVGHGSLTIRKSVVLL